MAESTFGRRAVNDGKFVARLRDGARITPETLSASAPSWRAAAPPRPQSPPELLPLLRVAPRPAPSPRPAEGAPSRNFRFFDNRQKYLLFVNTCSEKEVIARRVGMELAQHPPAAAGGARVRRRHGRRHGAHARDARDAPALPDAALLLRRQGDQPRGRAPVARQDGRPLLRAPGHRAGGDQHVLQRGALAHAEGARRGDLAPVARGGAHRHARRTSSASRSRRWSRSCRRTGRRATARPPATRSTSGRSRWCCTARTSASCWTTSSRSRAARAPTTTW